MHRSVMSACAAAIMLLAPASIASAQYQFEVVRAFDSAGTEGKTPAGALLEAADGTFYGTTRNGGAGDAGVVFRILADRTVVTTNLQGNTTGTNPSAGLIQTPDGTLFGTTEKGGANSSGTLFSISGGGMFLTYDLPKVTTACQGPVPAQGPTAPLVLAPEGKLYVPVPGAGLSPCFFQAGGVISLDRFGTLTKTPLPFVLTQTRSPFVVGSNGSLYSTGTMTSGPNWAFVFDTVGQVATTIHDFTNAEGTATDCRLLQATDGYLYGTSSNGGSAFAGTVFRMTAAGEVTVLHTFQGSDGAAPRGALVAATDGFFYGVTWRGGASNAGTIFKIDGAGNFSTVYTFTGGADGGEPLGGLIQGKDGSLYGTTSTGGPAGGGVVFRIKAIVSQPLITIDLPGATTANPVYVAGWALDHGAFTGTGIDAVHVYAFPNWGSGTPPIFLGVANYGTRRADIGSIFGTQFTNVGYSLASTLAPGPYLIAAFGHSTVTGTFSTVATRTVTVVVPQSLPAMALDLPAPGATVPGSFVVVAGWAIDRGAVAGTGVSSVHVWALPANGGPAVFLGVASYGLGRPDIGAIFGAQFTNSAYLRVGTLPPGSYTIAAFAYSTITSTFNNVRTVNVVVQ